MQVEFTAYSRKVKCDVSFMHYSYDNSTVIYLDEEDGPYGAATVCLENSNLAKDHVIMDINNMKEAIEPLKEVGFIEGEPLRFVQSGFVSYPVYKLTEKALELIEE